MRFASDSARVPPGAAQSVRDWDTDWDTVGSRIYPRYHCQSCQRRSLGDGDAVGRTTAHVDLHRGNTRLELDVELLCLLPGLLEDGRLVRLARHRSDLGCALSRARDLSERVRFYRFPTNDAWARDHGAIFVTRPTGEEPRLAVDFDYNAWGG